MESHDYDVVGIRKDGVVEGYVGRESLSTGRSGDYAQPFTPKDLISEAAPLIDVFAALRDSPRVFVTYLDRVTGLVTKGDLQKAPVRMWLFGIISLLEMQLLRLIRACYPDDTWVPLLSPPRRVGGARRILNDRRTRNEEIDLVDCLQFGERVLSSWAVINF